MMRVDVDQRSRLITRWKDPCRGSASLFTETEPRHAPFQHSEPAGHDTSRNTRIDTLDGKCKILGIPGARLATLSATTPDQAYARTSKLFRFPL